jgi:hypothetical protein
MDDINTEEHIEKIRHWIAEHIEADLQIAERYSELDGVLGRADWSDHRPRPLIQISRHISKQDIENYFCALGMRGAIYGYPELVDHAYRLETAANPSLACLQHLVLHEVAHARYKWGQPLETQCDLWASRIMTSSGLPAAAGTA